MELSRRGLLRFGATGSAGLLATRLSRKRRDGGAGAAQSLQFDPVTVHGYEEGLDATPVPVGDGVVAVAGAPVYSSVDAAHGVMGWLSSAPVSGGRICYTNPAPAGSSGSVYLVPRMVSAGATATVVGLWTDAVGGSAVGRLRLVADHTIEVVDSSSVRRAVSAPLWLPGQRVRVDWRQTWDGATLSLTVWLYANANSEGWRPDAVLQTTFPAGSPAFVAFGEENNPQVTVGFDTYREFDEPVVPSPYEPAVGVAALHSYDEGADGARVVAGANMVVAVSGAPVYATTAAMHGVRGVLLPNTGPAVLRYDNPYPPAHTGSLYVRTMIRGGADSRIVTVQHGSAILAQLKLAKNGSLYVADATGTLLSQTPVRAQLARWTRIDWQQTWDGTSLVLGARLFSTDPESFDNYTEVSAVIPAADTPDSLGVGTSSAAWKIQLDTLRLYGDVAAWPDPFDPHIVQRAPGIVAWAGDATQTTVEISGYTNDTTSVGLLVSPNQDLEGATVWPSAAPNSVGWNKWSVTGLTAGTPYYHQLTDTPDGGEPALIGTPSTFTTLLPVGTECTTRLAVFSCGQTAPANPAAFADIVAWAPDRTVHLGDFGYPNDLTRDITTHMDNWSRNATDDGFRSLFAVGCMDYIISDHDVNGTGNSNLPNFNDPVTMASLVAWQQVVPARIEDTESPLHGRWRSDVEGNVRFVKLDTRSIDKSDTTTTPTDPRSPDSTMLGAAQLGWLKAQIDTAAAAHQLVVLYTDCAWNGTSPGPPIPATFSDKWPSYIFERDLVSDYAATAGAQLFIVFGDSHGLQQDDGTHEKNGFASICCGPLDQELHMHYQDSYQWNYPAGISEEGGPYRHAQQYHRLTIAQEVGSTVVTVIAEGRDCSPVIEGTPLTVSTMTKVYQL